MVSGVNTQSLHNFPIAAAGGWVRERVCVAPSNVRCWRMGAVACAGGRAREREYVPPAQVATLMGRCWKKRTGMGRAKARPYERHPFPTQTHTAAQARNRSRTLVALHFRTSRPYQRRHFYSNKTNKCAAAVLQPAYQEYANRQ